MLEERILRTIKENKSRYCYYTQEGDRVIIGIRDTRRSNPKLLKDLKSLGLTPVNIVYGRWQFKIQNYTTE